MPAALLLPAGLAVVIVVAQLATATDATAELATPAVVIVAATGFVLSEGWARRLPERAALAAAGVVFAFYAAPVVLSGPATFTGFVKLDDTATWLALTDRVMAHGRSLAGLAPSTYEATLRFNLPTGYPVGSFLPLGIGHELSRQDSAWLFQPIVALYAAMLALPLFALLEGAIASPRLRALCAAIAAQSALLFGYAAWGGIKEIATAFLLATFAALAPQIAVRGASSRTMLAPAAAGAALLAVVSVGGIAWLGPIAAWALYAALREHGTRHALKLGAVLAAAGLILALPALLVAHSFLAPLEPGKGGGGFTSQVELGNLLRPLNDLQLLGIWPAADFRVDPAALDATHVLIVIAALAAITGVLWAAVRGGRLLAVYGVAAAASCAVIVHFASPWVDAKTLAIASPAVLLCAVAAAAMAWETGRRVEGGLLGAALAGGVLWSNALAYHGVNVAPRAQLRELEHIGHLAAGEGPLLMTEYSPYGARHFLRRADPESVSELRRRQIPLSSGSEVVKGNAADVDELAFDALLVYRSLVVRRSPVASRPPGVYRLVWRGHTYELWQRPAAIHAPLQHLALGTPLSAGAVPRCSDVRRLAARAGAGGRLVTAARTEPTVASLALGPLPTGWRAAEASSGAVVPDGIGTLALSVFVRHAGEYGVWVGGAVRGKITAFVDGRRTGSASSQLAHLGAYIPLGRAALGAGRHTVSLKYVSSVLRPGSGGQGVLGFRLGPLVLGRDTAAVGLLSVAAARADTLCGRRLDWIEAYAG